MINHEDYENICILLESADRQNFDLGISLLKNLPELKREIAKQYAPLLDHGEGRVEPLYRLYDRFQSIKTDPKWSLSRMSQKTTLNVLNILPQYVLNNIQKLALDDYNLRKIPQVIAQLNRLEELSLNRNNIEEIPDFLANLEFLKKLSLVNNKIKVVPKSLSKLPKLKAFMLMGNPIPRLEKKGLKKMFFNCRIVF